MSPMVLMLALLLAVENPADLAARVVSGDPGQREEAEGALEEIGDPALAALRKAMTSTQDLAASRRLADLIDRIERRHLLRATPVSFDLKDVPLNQALADLGRSLGYRLMLDPTTNGFWASKRVTCSTKGSLGFWQALDRLGEAGEFQHEPTVFWFVGPPSSEPLVRLVLREGTKPRTSYAGPYRVDLLDLIRHRQATQTRTGTPPKILDDFHVDLALIPEPGFEIDRNGSPRIDEAVDDQGNDLRPPTVASTSNPYNMSFRQWRPDSITSASFAIPLAIPSRRGGTLKRFRGTLPITAMRRTEPILTLKLDGSEGRPVTSSGVTLNVARMERTNNRISVIHLVVRGEPINPGPSIAPGPRQLTVGRLSPMYHADDHVQIVDDQGRPHGIFSGLSTPKPDGSFEARIQIHTSFSNGPPTTLRYFGVVGEAVEVPFTFEAVPLP